MRRHSPLLLPVLVFALGGRAGADEPQPADPAAIEAQVKAVAEEYEALRSNQDLVPVRRRRELARRLGTLKSAKSADLLNQIIEEDGDTRTQIFAMYAVAKVGDVKALARAYRKVLKEQRSVLPHYLGRALGLAGDPAAGMWILDKVLKNGNRTIRLGAVEALGLLRTPEANGPILELIAKEEKRAQDDVHLYFEALRTAGAIGGEGTKPVLLAAAASPDWRVRLAAAEALVSRHRAPDAVEAQRALLKDEVFIVRETAAIAVGAARMEPLFPELILLMREGNLRSKVKAFEAMKQISGVDYGYAPDAWDKWWRDKQAGRLTEAGEIKNRETMSIGSYYDFKIYSDRVLFVVDVSGSMQWPDYHPNRIEVAKRELRKGIESLSEQTLFNLMTFAGSTAHWEKGEVQATDANKRRALEWAEKFLLPRGGTNTDLALEESLTKNPLVDTVFFLSDGIPSAGKVEVPEEILVRHRYNNRFRRVIFNTIALAIGKASIEKAIKYEDPDEMAAFMGLIAEENGGTCVDIRKPWAD